MHANVVTLRYKSPHALETALARLDTVLADVRRLAGFRGVHFVRTGPDTTIHFALYDSEADADAASAKMVPLVRDAVGEHLAGPPETGGGDVVLVK